MSAGELSVSVEVNPLNFSTSSRVIEKLLSHFLYSRGQIEQPIEQLRNEVIPKVKTELRYANRSTPYQNKGYHLFATPLATSSIPPPQQRTDNADLLVDLLDELDINNQKEESKEKVSPVPETPVTTKLAQKRRVLGKLQEVRYGFVF